jgi:predicted metal-dependent hydrolase
MDEMPEEFWQGVDQFNQQEFYACHDTLEAIWINAMPADKNFFQGILQIAVALYHLGNENWQGAVTLMGEGIYRLHAYPSLYGGIDVDEFVADAAQLLAQLQAGGAAQVGSIAQQLQTPALAMSNPAIPLLKLPLIQRV